MIIRLSESKLFTTHPSFRFADKYLVSPDIYQELWRRYRLLEYSIPELCEFYYIKVGTPIDKAYMDKWMFRGAVYMKAQEVMKKGVECVNSEFFGDYERRLIEELLKNIKSKAAVNTKVLA